MADNSESDADEEDTPIDLQSLPAEVLLIIAQLLLPPNLLADAPHLWQPLMRFGACATGFNEALADACVAAFPAFRAYSTLSSSAWGVLLGGLHAGGCGKWLPCQPLRAVRAQQPGRQPVQSAPKLSGASLCAIQTDTLCLFGGRSSVTCDTRDTTYLVSIAWSNSERGVALWDLLQAEVRPPARCYHTATLWGSGQPSSPAPMVIFGGAGVGDAGDGEGLARELVFNDAWVLERSNGGTPAAWVKPWQWRQLEPRGEPPAPRSSHVCVSWPDGDALVLHGGLGNEGVTGDVWLLRRGYADGGRGLGLPASSAAECAWDQLTTSGREVRRAHHAAGLVRDSLLIYSGQDENLLTVHKLASLDLTTATWRTVSLPTDSPSTPPAPSRRYNVDPTPSTEEAIDVNDASDADDEKEEAGAAHSFSWEGSGQEESGSSDRWGERNSCHLDGPAVGDGQMTPLARIDGAAATIDGVGLLVFGGVGDDFSFVPSSNAWLLKSANETRPQMPAASQFCAVPRARACLGLCADGLRAYAFGGFDGEQDLDDLWCLSLLPAAFSATGSRGGVDEKKPVGRYGRTPEEMQSAIDKANEIKALRAAQATVLHATPGANGNNFIPIHIQVYQAGMEERARRAEQGSASDEVF